MSKLLIFKALMVQTFLVFGSKAQCFNVTLMTKKQFGLSEKQFWRAKAQDVEQCAVLCVRRSTCSSINYDTQSRLCELNNGTKADTPIKTGPHLLYSEFRSWPSSIDPHCFSRPCTHLEVCLPGSLANGNTANCSHSCMRTVFDVCPMPEVGVSNGRTVGIENILTCGKGFIGGGKATCLDTKMWDKELSPCIPIYDHPCSDDAFCSEIKASCDNGSCGCVGQSNSFNETLRECVIDCGEPISLAPTLNAKYSGDDKNTRNIICNDGFYPITGSVSTITCTANGWDQINFSCYACVVEPPPVSGATLSGNGRTRQYKCESGLYPNPKGENINGEITCHENGTWGPTGFICGGLRLKNGTHQQVLKAYSGYLEMYVGGIWKALSEKWTWEATMVACKTLFNLTYGGTYHINWFDDSNQKRADEAIKLDNILCRGNETVLEQCTYTNKSSNFDKEIALTCFDYNISDAVKISDSTDLSGPVMVNISGEVGRICSDSWDDKNTNVACRTVNQSWKRDGDYDTEEQGECQSTLCTNNVDCVDEHVPHLFYCQNKGWGYNVACDKLISIKCKLNN